MRTKQIFANITLVLAFVFTLSACGSKTDQTTDKTKDEKKDNQQTQTQTQTTDKKDVQTQTSDKKETQITDKKNIEGSGIAEIKLPTVQCDQCKKNLTRAFKKAVGVTDFIIDIDGKVVKVNYDKSKTDLTKIENVITAAGYDANDKKADKDAYDNLDDCCKIPKDRNAKK